MNDCHNCKFKRNVPGNTHIKCINPDESMEGDSHGIKNGWFIYPFLFDPIWATKKCLNYSHLDDSEDMTLVRYIFNRTQNYIDNIKNGFKVTGLQIFSLEDFKNSFDKIDNLLIEKIDINNLKENEIAFIIETDFEENLPKFYNKVKNLQK